MTQKLEECSKCKGSGIEPGTENTICNKCSGLRKLDWIQNATGFKLSREQKAILFVIKSLNKLVEMGIMAGGNLQLDERVENIIKDFNPTDDELKKAVAILKHCGYVQ